MRDFLKQEHNDILKKIQEQSEYIFNISKIITTQRKEKPIITTSIKSRRVIHFFKEHVKIYWILTSLFYARKNSWHYRANSRS